MDFERISGAALTGNTVNLIWVHLSMIRDRYPYCAIFKMMNLGDGL